jgi:hypothetical protein
VRAAKPEQLLEAVSLVRAGSEDHSMPARGASLMARGISAFDLYWHKPIPPHADRPSFHRYGCPFCDFFVQLPARGPGANALARAAIGKARVRAHVVEKHPEKL